MGLKVNKNDPKTGYLNKAKGFHLAFNDHDPIKPSPGNVNLKKSG